MPLGVGRANAADHAGAEIFLDAFDRGWWGCFEEFGAKLQAMGGIVRPAAGGLDEFPGRNRCGMAEDGQQIALASRLDPQDAETVLVIMESHPLDEAGEDFGFRIVLHRLSNKLKLPLF
jgi:hypothetical protein